MNRASGALRAILFLVLVSVPACVYFGTVQPTPDQLPVMLGAFLLLAFWAVVVYAFLLIQS